MANQLKLLLIAITLLFCIAFIFTMKDNRIEKAKVVNIIENSISGQSIVDIKIPNKEELITIKLDRDNVKIGDEILLKINKTTGKIKTLKAEKIEILGIVISMILIILIGYTDSKSYNHGIKIR